MVSCWNQPQSLKPRSLGWRASPEPGFLSSLVAGSAFICEITIFEGRLFEMDASAIKAEVRRLNYKKEKNKTTLRAYPA